MFLRYEELQTKKSSRHHFERLLMSKLQIEGKSNKYVKDFYEIAKQYINYPYVKFVMDIRNDEIHNNSRLDEYTDIMKLKGGLIAECSPFFIISNSALYNNIRQTLEAQVVLKESLQNILNNILKTNN